MSDVGDLPADAASASHIHERPSASTSDNDHVNQDERMMSVDELKQEMFKSLRDTGTIEAIRAQLRRRFIEKLQRHGRKAQREPHEDESDPATTTTTPHQWTIDQKLVHGLIHEYFQDHKMEHSMAVFMPEIGGVSQLLPREAITKMLHFDEKLESDSCSENQKSTSTRTRPSPLITRLMDELMRRLTVSTMNSGTQTAMDCQDHRLALENQLRRVENTYFADCEAQKNDFSTGNKSFEERIFKYQREYDAICDKKLQEELDRFKEIELALVRVEERKKYDKELTTIKQTIAKDHREKLQKLFDQEKEFELSFAKKKMELETLLWADRQKLFQEMEKVRAQKHDLEMKANSDDRHFAMETKRLQLMEEKILIREQNMENTLNGLLDEKEKLWKLDKMKFENVMKAKEETLNVREQDLEMAMEILKNDQENVKEIQKQMQLLESQLRDCENVLAVQKKQISVLEVAKKDLECDLQARDEMGNHDKHSMKSLTYENARLLGEIKHFQAEISKLEDLVVTKTSEIKILETEVKDLNHQVIQLKLHDANAVVCERQKWLQVLEQDQNDARWKENEWVGRIRELQTRLAESEAQCDKFQTQYDDERVHVETLRHEVASLHTLLAQAQAAASAASGSGGRNHSSQQQLQLQQARRNGSAGTGTGDSSSTSEQMLMRMMEIMMQMTGGRHATMAAAAAPVMAVSSRTASQEAVIAESHAVAARKEQEEKEDALRLKVDQERREKERLDQRESARRKQQEQAQQEQDEQNQRRRHLEQERMEQEIQLNAQKRDDERRQQVEEQEQQKAMEAALVVEKKLLLETQIAAEQRRLQEERVRKEKEEEEEENDLLRRRAKEKQAAEEEEEEKERQRQQVARQLQEEDERNAMAKAKQKQAAEEEEEEEKRKFQLTQLEEAEQHAQALRRQQEDQDEEKEEAERRDRQKQQQKQEEEDNEDQQQAVFVDRERPVERQEQHQQEQEPGIVSPVATAEDMTDAEGYHSDEQEESDDEESKTEMPPVRTATPPPAEDEEDGKEAEATELVEDADPILRSDSPRPGATEEIQPDTTSTSPATAAQQPLAPVSNSAEEDEREAKAKQDQADLDVYRQRVLARRAAAEKQRQQQAQEKEQEEQRRQRDAAALSAMNQSGSEDDDGVDKSSESFASSAASSSGSF